MKPVIVKSLRVGLLGLLIGGSLSGCYVESYHPVPPPPPPAPVYGWYPYDYYYYPSVGVYFQITTGYYWYHDHGHWYRARRLPPHIVILPRDRVHLRIDKGEPWRYHQQHTERYQPRVTPTPDYRKPRVQERGEVEREHNRRIYREHEERRERRPEHR